MEFVKYLPTITLMFFISSSIAIIWINSTDKIKKQHPDYKGEEFLDEDDKIQIG